MQEVVLLAPPFPIKDMGRRFCLYRQCCCLLSNLVFLRVIPVSLEAFRRERPIYRIQSFPAGVSALLRIFNTFSSCPVTLRNVRILGAVGNAALL